jgi:alkanesulfonate monooxygenase SsuD/methylene tetrahydromethanopterin reductase-like flavin-dependent oxidoreductase (luciferase family)
MAGWLAQELIDFGVNPRRKRARVREHILAMREIWSSDEPSFSGEFVTFPPMWSWPKPPGADRVPIMMGAAASERTFDHVVEYCDGWMPSIRGDIDTFATHVARLREKAQEAGRDPASLRIDVIAPFRSVELFEGFEKAGVGRVILHLPFADFDTVRQTLDEYDRDFFRHFAQ